MEEGVSFGSQKEDRCRWLGDSGEMAEQRTDFLHVSGHTRSLCRCRCDWPCALLKCDSRCLC
jgi:hypothetical protein